MKDINTSSLKKDILLYILRTIRQLETETCSICAEFSIDQMYHLEDERAMCVACMGKI